MLSFLGSARAYEQVKLLTAHISRMLDLYLDTLCKAFSLSVIGVIL